MFNTRFITRVAIFGAVSGLLYTFVKFPLPFLPPFLEMNFSDIPAIIAGYAYGPISGILVQVIKVIIKLVTVGTGTAYVGEIADIILGIIFVLPASLYYKYNRTFKGSIIGAIITLILHTISANILNEFFLLPFYIELYAKGDASAIINWAKSVNPNINSLRDLVYIGVLPFNIIKNTINLAITFLVYKRLFSLINRKRDLKH